MQPFALAVTALKAAELKTVELEASALEASALEAWTQGRLTLPEDEISGGETRQRLKLTDQTIGSVLLLSLIHI